MAGIYVRNITISRPASTLSAAGGKSIAQPSQNGGSSPYLGLNYSAANAPANPVIAANIPCSIQAKGSGTTSAGMPSGAPGPVRWKIYIPLGALAPRTVKDRDLIVDDEGQRYQVTSNYWNILGYALEAVREEAGQ